MCPLIHEHVQGYWLTLSVHTNPRVLSIQNKSCLSFQGLVYMFLVLFEFVVCCVFLGVGAVCSSKEMAHKRRHCYCNILKAKQCIYSERRWHLHLLWTSVASSLLLHLSNRWSPYPYGKSLHWTVLTLEWWGVVLFLVAESCFPYILGTKLPKSFSLLTSFAIAALKPAAETFLKPDFCFKYELVRPSDKRLGWSVDMIVSVHRLSSFSFKTCGLWTVTCDLALHN